MRKASREIGLKRIEAAYHIRAAQIQTSHSSAEIIAYTQAFNRIGKYIRESTLEENKNETDKWLEGVLR